MYIALLEDEPTLSQEVNKLLVDAGHRVAVFGDGNGLLRALSKDTFDLFVLDWHVPGPNGLEILKYIRQSIRLVSPVVFLTSNHAEDRIVAALNAGADDYCSKPLKPAEFMARIQAIQRRLFSVVPAVSDGELYKGFVFNRAERSVSVDGTLVRLSEKEYDLCHMLFANIEQPLARHRIMMEVWGREENELSRTLDVHISWVRRKLGIGAQGTRLRLNVVQGFGYRLDRVGTFET